MELVKILKQLKNIAPDPDYVRKSRLLIVGEDKKTGWPILGWRTLILSTFQSLSAMALVALFLLLLLGGFSAWNLFSPNKVGLDAAGLRAEAEAIDIQIQLTKIAYHETILQNQTTTTAFASIKSETFKKAEKEAADLGLTTTSSSILNIDQALDKLSQ